MKVINPNDTVQFEDADGDLLICLRSPRNRAYSLREELAIEEVAKIAKIFKDFDLKSIEKEKIEEARQNINKTPAEIRTLAIKEFMFKSVAMKLVIKGNTIEGEQELIDTYRNLDSQSAKWIDDCIESIWKKAEVPENKKK